MPSSVESIPAYTSGRCTVVARAIEHVRHYLPTQGPLSVFVHHNTLHSFEELPFEQAVLEGARFYGCQPYWAEERFRDELANGRISLEDIRQVLMDDLGDDADRLIATFGTRYTLRLSMLQVALDAVPEAELQWLLSESEMLCRFRKEVTTARREYTLNKTRAWAVRRFQSGGSLVDITATGNASRSIDRLINWEELAQQVRHAELQIQQQNDRKVEWSKTAWTSLTLRLMWQICRAGVKLFRAPSAVTSPPPHLHQLLLQATGEDTDVLVNDCLIRFVESYLDQGYAGLSLPERELGFARAFARIYSARFSLLPDWMLQVRSELAAVDTDSFDALESISHSLSEMGVDDAHVEDAICRSMLALRGWAGMLWQTESDVPFLAKAVPSGTLNEYLAIRLILERAALKASGRRLGRTEDLHQLRKRLEEQLRLRQVGPTVDERAFVVFQLAQVCGWLPEQLYGLTPAEWRCLLDEIEAFGSFERRRIFHAAYEKHYRVQALDAVIAHSRHRRQLSSKPESRRAYAAVFCIDDREESFRRHLEEVDPECVTTSAAGFFAVAMYYQGADHAHYRPLCPAIVTPQHYVQEQPLFSEVANAELRAERRRRLGLVTHQVHSHSRTLVGGWLTTLLGALATIPMVARILAPRVTARLRARMGNWVRPPATELHIERLTPQPGTAPDQLGYSLDEMAGIVVRILQDIGIVANFPRMVLFFGHGSSSLNNPHESAYNCGACSGGRGGPNARAFALMANDTRVRRLVSQRGIDLPEDVRFVGAYHNTCSDAVEYYDLDLLPRSHRQLFRRIEQNINEARKRNAHERARRFESAALDMSTESALEHVEQRSEDLSQARPEYNHASNALVAVGRRDWTRGLFMDRRAFLTEYDPSIDDAECQILTRILQAAIPVCAGISLEYYFSTVDNEGYGCGSKLPHNVTSLLGVMTGAASDLRPGLSQQMVEIHEPMRILFIVETTPERMQRIIQRNAGIARLVMGNWVQLATFDPASSTAQLLVDGQFVPYVAENIQLPRVPISQDWYGGHRSHLGFAQIAASER